MPIVAPSASASAATGQKDIIVTAPSPLEAAFDVRSSQTVTAAELQTFHAVDLTDALKRLFGGVIVNEVQGNPLQPDVSYHGYTASPLLGTPQGLTVYMDGVRLNQPFGEVVSWDLIPKSAIRRMTIIPSSNPLFGANALGGTLSIETKSGRSDPGVRAEASYGSFNRRVFSAEAGGTSRDFDWFVSGDRFQERGWRAASPSKASQLFGKVGWSDGRSQIHLIGSYAHTNLNGNGLQEMRLLSVDRRSVYSYPDTTANRAGTASLTVRHPLSETLRLDANVHWRGIRSRTFNGDVNDDALGENPYQPTAAEIMALQGAGYTGYPIGGETAANTPFPSWRCIANILLNTEPNEKCDGLVNRSRTDQHEFGAAAEVTFTPQVLGLQPAIKAGLTYLATKAEFGQSSQFGYLVADRSVVTVAGPGAFADGSQASEDAFDARVALTNRTSTLGAYASAALKVASSVTLELATRYDRTRVHNVDGITPGGGVGSLDGRDVFEKINPAATIRYEPSSTFSLFGSIAQTSRAPSAIELGCADPASPCRLPNALAGDPPLKQVVARTLEAGGEAKLGILTGRIAIYRTINRQDILFVSDSASGYGYFRNFGRTRRQGLDLDVEARRGPVHAGLHYSYVDATYRGAETVDGSANSSADHIAPGFGGTIRIMPGDRLPLIPLHSFKANVAWDVTRTVQLEADMIAVSATYARGNENNRDRADGIYYLGSGKTGPYAVFNIGGEWKAAKGVSLFCEVSNVFNRYYATAAQLATTAFDASGHFVARPFSGPVIDGERPLLSSTFYTPGAPRAIQSGVRMTF